MSHLLLHCYTAITSKVLFYLCNFSSDNNEYKYLKLLCYNFKHFNLLIILYI